METTRFTFIDSIAREALVLEDASPSDGRPTASYHWMRWRPSLSFPRRAR